MIIFYLYAIIIIFYVIVHHFYSIDRVSYRRMKQLGGMFRSNLQRTPRINDAIRYSKAISKELGQ